MLILANCILTKKLRDGMKTYFDFALWSFSLHRLSLIWACKVGYYLIFLLLCLFTSLGSPPLPAFTPDSGAQPWACIRITWRTCWNTECWALSQSFERLLLTHEKMPGFLTSGRQEFNLEPETRLDRSELLCNRVLLKYKRDRESFWHRHQKGTETVPPLLVLAVELYTF